jgi:tRNA(adenine34) deaminase
LAFEKIIPQINVLKNADQEIGVPDLLRRTLSHFLPKPSSCYAPRMAESDLEFMRAALDEARTGAERGEVPIGAVLVHEGTIIARAHNRTLTDNDPTAHAEMVAIRAAAQTIRNHRLNGTSLYVTVEPCAMCAGAMIQARVARLIYGCAEQKGGAVRTCFQILDHPAVNHRVEVISGMLAEECAAVMQEFFAQRR